MLPNACHDIGILSSLNVTPRVQIPSRCTELVLIALVTNAVLQIAVRCIDRKDRFIIERTFQTSPEISNPTELVSGCTSLNVLKSEGVITEKRLCLNLLFQQPFRLVGTFQESRGIGPLT